MKILFVFGIVSLLVGCGTSPGDSSQLSQANTVVDYDRNDGSGGVQLFGDSIFTTSDHRIRKQLESLANVSITDHAVSGAVIAQIRDQYEAVRSQKIKTVIIDGGGNNILGNRSNCQNTFNDNCRSTIQNVAAVITETFQLMKEDGVHQIIYMGCHYPSGWNGGFDQSVDYGFTQLKAACAASAVPCILVDTRKTIRDDPNSLEWDGVHPNWNGTAMLAQLLWDETQKAGIKF